MRGSTSGQGFLRSGWASSISSYPLHELAAEDGDPMGHGAKRGSPGFPREGKPLADQDTDIRRSWNET